MAAYVTKILMNSVTEKAIQLVSCEKETANTPTLTHHHYTGKRVVHVKRKEKL